MPDSADAAAPGPVAPDLVKRGAASYAAGRTAEAAALLEQARDASAGAGAAGLPAFWELDAALALAAGDAARAITALGRARDLVRATHGIAPAHVLLNLALACIVGGQADAALVARDDAQAAIALREDLGEAAVRGDREQLREVDARLARLLWEQGRHDAAIAAMAHALAVRADDTARARLGAMLAWRGRASEALVAMAARALTSPDLANAARDLGRQLAVIGAHEAARAWFRRTLVLQPDDPVATAALAQAELADAPIGWDGVPGLDALTSRMIRPLQGQAGAPRDAVWPVALARALMAGRTSLPPGAVAADWDALARDAAIAALRRALALRPGQAEAVADLARLLLEQPDAAEGLEMLRAALKLAPADAMLHVRLGQQLRHQGEAVEAAQSFRVALALQPDTPQALLGLADALLAQGPDAQALALIARAEALDPAMPIAQAATLKAMGLLGLQRADEAIVELQKVLALRPDDADAHFGIGLALLATGRYAEGWASYAWRWRRRVSADHVRRPADPLRRPDPAEWAGKTVLLYAEQAQGDSIQFLRYARMVAAAGARVLLEVPGSLRTLAAAIPDMAGVYARGDVVPPFDIALPLLHLPWAFDTRLETVPATVPYLRADLTRAAQFRRRMQGLPGLKVGLVWSGEPRPNSKVQSAMDRRRSLTLAALAPLARVPGVVWVSLQKGAPGAQATDPPAGMVLHDWTGELEDFAATAALMTALDLVISVDTAPAHLAGALGRPVWLLNRFDSDFRWLQGRDDSPWYPTLRQFRQMRPGDWDEVVQRLAAALRERVG